MQVPLKREGGRWIVTGPLPNGVQIKDTSAGQVFASEAGELQPECFGRYWEAIGPESDDCRVCDLEPVCRFAVVHVFLPTVLGDLADCIDEATVATLAPELKINHEAMRALLADYQAAHEPETAASKTKRPKRAPRRRVVAETHADSEGAVTENPTLAPAAQLVAVGASPGLIASVSARIAEAWDAERRLWLRPWEAKWRRDQERKADEWIARLVQGMILRRSFAGWWWEVEVCRWGYRFHRIKYPTLQAATVALLSKAPHRHRMRTIDVSSPAKVSRWWCLPKLLLPQASNRSVLQSVVDHEVKRLRSVFWPEGLTFMPQRQPYGSQRRVG